MTDGHCFISYSNIDALDFATRLANELEGDFPPIPVWFDKRKIRAGHDWGDDLSEGIKTCKRAFPNSPQRTQRAQRFDP